MLKFSDRKFKITMINMLKNLVETVDNVLVLVGVLQRKQTSKTGQQMRRLIIEIGSRGYKGGAFPPSTVCKLEAQESW